MNKKFKCLWSLCLALVFVAIFSINRVNAATVSQDIKANEEKEGVLEESESSYVYTFTAPADGMFSVSLKNKNTEDKHDVFCFDIQNANSTESIFSEINIPSAESWKIGTKSGEKYIITVKKTHFTREEVTFKLKLDWENSNNWENEPNDQQSSARIITPNKDYLGTIVNNDKGDFFKVAAPQNGYFIFTVKHFDPTDNGKYHLEIFNTKSEEVFSTEDVMLQTNDNDAVTFKIGVRSGETLYAKVKTGAAQNVTGQVYKINAGFTPTEIFEMEDNNSTNMANAITYNTRYTGMTGNWADDKEDYYKFTVSTTSKVTMTFGAVDESSIISGWDVYLINSKNKSAKVVEKYNKKDTKTFNLKKGTYYIRIEGDNISNKTKEYYLQLTLKNLNVDKAKPVIKNAKVTLVKNSLNRNVELKTVTLKKGINDAEYYEVLISENAKMKKATKKIVSVNPIKNPSKLKIGKRIKSNKKVFYVQTRPYVEDPFGAKIYGRKSVIKKVKISR